MRADDLQFARANEAPSKRPRFVVAILFDVGSIYVTSHGDIPNVPGIVIESALKAPSSISQKIVPDEGRTEIGSFSASIVDLGADFTDEVRAKLGDEKGLRGKTVQLWVGFEGFDFTAFQLFQTQIVTGCGYHEGVYTLRCSDISREQRQDICEPVSTTLQAGCSESDTTIQVLSTTQFEPVAHGAGWSDAPSQTVYYFRLEDEIIRATGKTSGSFTGCTRGVLNTLAVPHVFDPATAQERRPKIEEFIYLELPAPKLAYAILTGIIYGTSDTLPDHWHLGIDPALVRTTDFTGIGPDLWDTGDDTRGFILRFDGLKKQDGKRFLERQVYLLLGAYSPIYSDGTLGLRRLPALITDASPVATLTEREVVSVSPLEHDYSSLHNRFQIDWAYDSGRKEYTRRTSFIDGSSVTIHGASPILTLAAQGLHGGLHTDEIIRRRIDAIRDAYAYPPQRLTVECLPSLNRLEVGDVVRVNIANVRDFAGEGDAIDRAFLILQRSIDFATGELSFETFGSTLRPDAEPPSGGSSTPLPDGFYNAAGTALNTVIGMTGNTVNAGTHTINGNADLNASGAVFYHLGDLTIPDGAVINITGNVQLRVRGFVTLNGDIVGSGSGHAGTSDGGGAITSPIPGNPGFIGNSRGGDGIRVTVANLVRVRYNQVETVPAALTQATYQAFPDLDLRVEGSTLLGLPSDLRGTGGAPGGRVLRYDSVEAVGGAGAAGGAGLAIISRGMTVGLSGSITLDGASATPPAAHTGIPVFDHYPGTGGAGGPGALLIALDGNALSIPNIAGRFFARTGTVAIQGYPIPGRSGQMTAADNPLNPWTQPLDASITGYLDESLISQHDYSNSAFRVFYVVGEQTATPDADQRPPPLMSLSVTGESGFNAIRVEPPPAGTYDYIEYWASLDNNRANAVLIGSGNVTEFKHELPVLAARYYWGRTVRITAGNRKVYSDWEPTGATSGIVATTLNPAGWTPVVRGASGSTVIATVSTIEKSGGTGAWDSDCYSLESYPACFVSFRAAQTNAAIVVGLDAAPSGAATRASVDYGWELRTDGTLRIVENTDSGIDPSLSYDTSTVLAVIYDGERVQYLRNGSVVRSVLASGSLALDNSFYTPGGKIVDVKFGPTGQSGADGSPGTPGTPGADGDDGDDGLSIAELAIYLRAASAPSTPTGGSYNFGTQTLTPPSGGWTSAVPSGNNPVYTSRAVASIVGQTGTDSTLTWSAPVLVLAEGASVDIVFRRAATQPSTPSPSSGTPASWYSNVGSVPAGLEPIWSSVGTRSNAGQNWTWQTPIQVEGTGGGSNLLSVALWREGALSAALGPWSLNQSTSDENQIINSIGPRGVSTLVWECRCQDPGTGTGGDANGGWNNSADLANLDATKTYRSIVWIRRRASTGGNIYHGCATGGATVNLNDSANSNPYFLSGVAASTLEADRWYLSVGFIHGNGYSGGNSGQSGLYDPATGSRVLAATEYKMAPSATTQTHRAYMYYGGDTSTRVDFAEPRFEEVNGNEPSIASLLVPPDADNTAKQRLAPDAEFALPNSSEYWVVGNKCTLASSGGAIGGLMRLVGNGATPPPNFRPRRFGVACTAGQSVSITCRLRRTTTLTPTGSYPPALLIYLSRLSDADGTFGSGEQMRWIDLSNLVLNTWTEVSLIIPILNTNPAVPFVGLSDCVLKDADMSGGGGHVTGTLEIDYLNAALQNGVQGLHEYWESSASGWGPNSVDKWSTTRFTNVAGTTVTLPTTIPSLWKPGDSTEIIRGAGEVVFASSGTIESPAGLSIVRQGGRAIARLIAAGAWQLSGDLGTATNYVDNDTSTSFTVGNGHAETIRRFTSSSAIAITLPNSIPSGWTVGQSMVFIRGGTGTLTFSSSGTIRSPGGNSITMQNGKAAVTLAASGVWELSGNV